MNFKERIVTPTQSQKIKMDGYFVWCCSAIKAEDGKYHVFASRWKEEDSFQSWVTQSEIVRFESSNPEGPYEFKEVLDSLKTQDWCCKMVHNPVVTKVGDKYYLYYTGTTYPGGAPSKPNEPHSNNVRMHPARFYQRIGVAVSDSIKGPWVPSENNPILKPRAAGNWDSTFTSNPSVFVRDDGKIQLIYKSMLEGSSIEDNILILGMAVSDSPEGPFERTGPSPLFDYDVEDPFIWKEDGKYWMLVKDMKGAIVPEKDGILLTSDDGENWSIAENKHAYDHVIKYQDGTTDCHEYTERPQLLIVDGKPVCFFAAVGDNQTYSYNVVRLIK